MIVRAVWMASLAFATIWLPDSRNLNPSSALSWSGVRNAPHLSRSTLQALAVLIVSFACGVGLASVINGTGSNGTGSPASSTFSSPAGHTARQKGCPPSVTTPGGGVIAYPCTQQTSSP